VKPFSEVIQAFGSERVVVPLPAELRLQVASARERLAGLNDVEVLRFNIWVRDLIVLGGDQDALTKETLVDLLAVGFRNQHFGCGYRLPRC